MLLTKEVEVIPSGKNIQYYKDLGYDVKWRKPLKVKIEDLSKHSKVKVLVLCDYCEKNIMTVTYANHLKSRAIIDKDSCVDCKSQKTAESNLFKYGVASTSQLPEVREKVKATFLSKYGVDSYAKTQECKEKRNATMMELYGVEYAFQRKDFIEKRINKLN